MMQLNYALMMRTTISIQDSLLAQAKALSRERKCSLGEVIEEALRLTLTAQPKRPPQKVRPWKTFKGSGLQPGVTLNSSAALLEAMEGR